MEEEEEGNPDGKWKLLFINQLEKVVGVQYLNLSWKGIGTGGLALLHWASPNGKMQRWKKGTKEVTIGECEG